MNVLVLGGYGNFGARICRALAGNPDITLLVGGRSAGRAASLAAELGADAKPVVVDHGAPDFAAVLRQHGVGLVIHTAGPFQHQGYGVAEAAATAGAHYIDLADGRRFVCDFADAMDARFRAAGLVAISGASTVPALSSAIVDHLCQGWQHIDAIDCCIAPAQTAPRGEATLAAVLSYCGEPLQVWADGRWQARRGWARPERVHFARLRPRLGALCDIPDLELFPAHYQVHQRVMFRAALELGCSQRVFAALAAARAAGWLRRPARLAGALQWLSQPFDRLGSSLGGMVLHVEGTDAQGRPARRAWHIAADHDHGPEIPTFAAVLLARQLAQGRPGLDPGARAAVGLLPLAAFAPEFAKWGMVTDIVYETTHHGAPNA